MSFRPQGEIFNEVDNRDQDFSHSLEMTRTKVVKSIRGAGICLK